METSILKCKQCGGPMDYREGSKVLNCPHCGFSEIITESDAVIIERIRAEAYKETELGKQKIEKDADIKKKAIKLKKTGLLIAALFLVLALLAAGFMIYHKQHEGKVRIKQSFTSYIGEDHEKVRRLFEEAGFVYVEEIPQKTLTKQEQNQIGVVSEVSIDGDASFEKGWYSNKALISIYYYDLDPERANDIQIPMDSSAVVGMEYQEVVDRFISAGFKNITLLPAYEIKLGLRKEEVQSVTLNGKDFFFSDEWVPNDSAITIAYRAKTIDYIDDNYEEIARKLKDIGFLNIVKEPLNDLSINETKKEGKVTSVLIDGAEYSTAGKLNLQSDIVIQYHSRIVLNDDQIEMTTAAKDMDNRNYEEIVALLEEIGFTNIRAEALGDLGKMDILKRDGKVKMVTIDNVSDFSIGDVFDKSAEVIVTYHSR